MRPDAAVVVAIPARNEQARVRTALLAVHLAIDRLRQHEPATHVTIVLAADACTDATAAIARDSGALVVETPHGRVGRARATAVGAGLATSPAAWWIANTDADSQVPADWLTAQLAAARSGADLLLGSVRPDEQELGPARFLQWLRKNPPGPDHGYVHGANLGIRTSTYLRLGGFPDLALDEDVALVEAARRGGAEVRATDRAPVVTSGRAVGRTPGGFSAYVRALGAEPGPSAG